MMCSTITMVMPPPWMRRTSSIASRTSVGVSPAIASSSSSALGSEASARAISSRLRPGVPRLLAGASSTAWKAPNALVTLRASISMAARDLGFGLGRRLGRTALEQRQEAARQEAGDDDDDGAVDHEGEAGTTAAEIAVRQLLQRHQ